MKLLKYNAKYFFTAVMMCVFFLCESMTVHASMPDLNDLKKGQREVYDYYYDLATGGTIGPDFITNVYNKLLTNDTDASFINVIWDFFTPLGICLVLLYWLMHIMQELSSGRKEFDIKYLALNLMLLVIAEVILANGRMIINVVISIANSTIEHFHDNPISSAGTIADTELIQYANNLHDMCKDLGTLEVARQEIMGFLIGTIAIVPNLAIYIHTAARRIEIILRGGFAVIAIPNFFDDSGKHGAVKYFKQFAVALFHGIAIILIVQIVSGLSASAMQDMLSNSTGKFPGVATLGESLIYSFAAMGCIPACRTILNDVFS